MWYQRCPPSSLLLLSASALLSKSPLSFKIAKPVAKWIELHNLKNRYILVYDKRLPSLAFELNKDIISLYDGDRSLDRETQFETDNRWKKYLYNLKDIKEQKRLKRFISENKTILVLYKKRLHKNSIWLKNRYRNLKEIGKWKIYY